MAAAATARIRIDFQPDGHLYFVDQEEYVSVTTMMAAEGMTDYEWCSVADRDRGSKVHRIAQILSRNWRGSTVEEIVRNSRWDVDKTTPALVGYGYAAAKFLLEKQFRPQLVEQPVASRGLRLAGALDAWGLLPSGQRLLPDYKSGRPLPAARVQVNLYAYLLKETFGYDTDLLAPVWLQKTGDYQMLPPQPPGGLDLNVGISAANVYHWRRKFNKL